MSVLSKQFLSGSTDGQQIKVTGTNSGGAVTVHTAHATAKDEVWIFADNEDNSADTTLTIQWGGTTDVDNTMKMTIPKRGTAGQDLPLLIIPGLLLTNSKVVKAFASSANKIKLTGHVIRDT